MHLSDGALAGADLGFFPPLDPNTLYAPEGPNDVWSCTVEWYNLMAACTACQSRDTSHIRFKWET
jgi:hypothetical protein